jgi:osmotically-inducible protein OsmY
MDKMRNHYGEAPLEHEAGPEAKPQGERIIADAKRLLFERSHLTVQRIWCEFDRGKLFLRGQVPSFYHKQLAQTAVAKMEGVDQVVNDIEVVW